jgi:hypothetical protein
MGYIPWLKLGNVDEFQCLNSLHNFVWSFVFWKIVSFLRYNCQATTNFVWQLRLYFRKDCSMDDVGDLEER